MSAPVTPSEELSSSPLEPIDESSILSTSNLGSPGTNSPLSGGIGSPSSPTSPGIFRRGHGRQSSLGTTSTSPSTRRRSIESTVSMIREVVDGKAESNAEIEAIADSLSSPISTSRRRSDSGSGSGFEKEDRKSAT